MRMAKYIEIETLKNTGYQIIRQTPSGKLIPVSYEELSDTVPAADVRENVRGYWCDANPDDSLDPRMRCSVCECVYLPLVSTNYCPNCGAEMGGGDDES